MNPQPDLAIWEKYTLFQMLCQFPALTAMLFRRQVGLRTFNPTALFIMTAAMIAVAHLTESKLLGAYAVLFWGVGSWQAYNRDREIKSGAKWSTLSGGISLWEYVPLPDYIRKEDRIYRILEPATVFIIGMVALPISQPLGMWIVFAGASMRVFEEFSYQRRRTALLDAYDAAIAAGASDEQLQQLLQGGEAARPQLQSDPGSVGISSGAGEDIRKQVEQRRAEQEARAKAARRAEVMAHQQELWQAEVEARRRVEEVQAIVDERMAATPPARDTIIIAASEHTSETVIVMKEETTFIPIAPPPAREMLAVELETVYLTHSQAPALPSERTLAQLAAPPPDEDAPDQAA